MVPKCTNFIRTAVVIVGYNSDKWLSECLKALCDQMTPGLTVIFVDNDSSDNSVSIARRFPAVRVVVNSSNLGFGVASNIGARLASTLEAEYLFFLNPDTRASTQAILGCTSFLDKNRSFGVVGPMQLTYGPFATQEYNVWTRRAVHCLNVYPIDHRRVEPSSDRSFRQLALLNEDFIETEYVQGAALAIRADLFRALGGFDARYFMFFEEVDLCRRARWLGFSVAMLPRLNVEHAWGGHAGGLRLQYWLTSKYLFVFSDPSLRYDAKRKLLLRHLAHDFVSCLTRVDKVCSMISALTWLTRHKSSITQAFVDNGRTYWGS